MNTPADIVFQLRGELIAQHYLRTKLLRRTDWMESQADPRANEIEQLFEQVRSVLQRDKPNSKGSNEYAVRDLLINPIFEILGLPWSPAVQHFGKQLDYALYENKQKFEIAQSLVNNGKEVDALRSSCAVAEAERWGKEFSDKPKRADLSDPIFQIEFYLGNARRSGGPRWGVLTNGHTWRLYCGDSDPLRHDFLEIELPTEKTLFSKDNHAAFQLLVYLFSSEALRAGGRLDQIYDAATRQAAGITAELRRQAFGAVELIGSGLMRSNPRISPMLAYQAALIQLFRLLFILKAEADGLLSSRMLSGDIAERIVKKNGPQIGGGEWDGKNFWHELNDIFETIAGEYNGHLFEGKPPTSSPAAMDAIDYFAPARALLESVAVPNQFTANALDRLLRVYQQDEAGRATPVRVDYSTLRVRELGTIYEGLLEWRLEPVSESEIKLGQIRLLGDKRIERKIAIGDYKLVADQADRKATGSYYTPHIVVEFIGTNILRDLLSELEKQCGGNTRTIIKRVLSQRILDPAMGSGHFLVFTVEYLANYISGQLGKVRAEREANKKKRTIEKDELPLPLDATVEFIRSRIAERCIYGVDINPLAVELAKLSLWIATAAKGVPLSFLNHHLRCGDSLLGVTSEEFHDDLFAYKLAQQMGLAVGFIRYINESFSHTLKDIGEKEEHLRVARNHLRRFRLAYDAQLAPFLGVKVSEGFHSWIEDMSRPVPGQLPDWLRNVETTASEFLFFHWELEFPEVWRGKSGELLGAQEAFLEPGFDVILGNPPFVTAKNELSRRAYIERWQTAIKGFHLLVPFFERGFSLLSPGGRLGFIVSNGFAKREFGKKLIEEFLPKVTVDEVIDCSGLSFPGHGTPTCIIFGRARKPEANHSIRVTATSKGDLRTPPEESPLWISIRNNHDRVGYSDEWIQVTARSLNEMQVHPWIFSAEAKGLLQVLDEVQGSKLESYCAEPIGAQFITGADDIYVLPYHVARRTRIPHRYLRMYATGEDVRDWQISPSAVIIFPYDAKDLSPLNPLPSEIEDFLTPFRPHLEELIISGSIPKKKTRLSWFEYRRLARAKLKREHNLIVPQIAMYNHACLSDHGVLFKEKAQAIAFRDSVSDSAVTAIMGCLNSSTAGFWLKQVCFNKGPGKRGERDRFEFSGNILGTFLIPVSIWENDEFQRYVAQLSRACAERGSILRSLDFKLLLREPGEAYEPWFRGLSGYTPAHPLVSKGFRSHEQLMAAKDTIINEQRKILGEMVNLQEEIDWATYALYGLIAKDDAALRRNLSSSGIYGLNPGERAFELASLNAGAPIDANPSQRALISARLQTLKTNPHVARIENSLFKRQWIKNDYEDAFVDACREWLLDKAEFHLERVAGGGPVTLEAFAAELFSDERVRAVACAIEGPNCTSARFRLLLGKVVEDQTVPTDANDSRPKRQQIRGKLGIPRERFLSFGKNPRSYIWAGKNLK